MTEVAPPNLKMVWRHPTKNELISQKVLEIQNCVAPPHENDFPKKHLLKSPHLF